MADYRAIAAAGAALAGLIRDRFPRDEFGSAIDAVPYRSADFAEPMKDGFSIFMYRATINGTRRNTGYRRGPDLTRLRPSLALDLYFMVTPWSGDALQQLRMLGWVMRMFEDLSVLNSSHLNHYLGGRDVFLANENVEIVNEPLALADYLTLWDRLANLPPSATYVLRMVMLDSDLPVGDGALVQARGFDAGGVTP